MPTAAELQESMLNPVRDYDREIAALEARVREVERSEEFWKDEAMRFSRNEEFYRGLVVKIGVLFGDEAKTSDDGSVQQDVLALKVPELVEAMKSDLDAARATIGELVDGLKPFTTTHLYYEEEHSDRPGIEYMPINDYDGVRSATVADCRHAAALVARHQQ